MSMSSSEERAAQVRSLRSAHLTESKKRAAAKLRIQRSISLRRATAQEPATDE